MRLKLSDLSEETIFAIDFNLHWVPAALGLEVSPEAAAPMLGISAAEFRAYTAEARAQVVRTAVRLLEQPPLERAIEGLAVPAGGLVMAVGDSTTTYRYSYAHLLAAMVSLRRPEAGIRFANVAQSGYTSTHGLENSYTQFLAQRPDIVFIKFGVNDCKRFGGAAAKTLVSLDEYRANMEGMVEAFRTHTEAQVVLLTPDPVVENTVNGSPDFQAMRMSWRGADLQARADYLNELAARYELPFVDLVELFGVSPDPRLYLPDGLHPNPDGQALILEAVLRAMVD